MRKVILLILLFLSISCISIYADDDMISVMPDADFFKKIEAPSEYYEAYRNRKLIGYCFNTKEASSDKQGYAGPMEILVALDTDFKILDLKILHHAETPEYAAKIIGPEFLGQFKGKGPDAGFKVGSDVDAITHATISCSAVCDILKEGIGNIYKALGGAKEKKRESEELTRLKNAGLEPREAKYYKVIDE